MSEEIIDGEVIESAPKSLAKYDEPVRHLSLNEISDISSVFVKSGLFKDTPDQAKAMVKIMAGNELGVSPFASMRGIDIINGKLVPNASLTGALIKRNTNPYDYRVIENSDTVCKIEFYKGGQLIGTTTFTMEDAQRAQLTNKDNWRKFPRQMLLARALSEGARNHCPDVFMGAIYSPDELDSVDAPPQQVAAQSAQPAAKPNDVNADIKTLWDKAAQYRAASQDGVMQPDKLKAFILNLARALKNAGQFSANDKQRKLLVILLSEMFEGDDTMRHIFTKHIFGVESTKELEGAHVNALLAWMEISQEQDGGRYVPSFAALAEAELALNYAMQAAQDEAQSVSAEEYENKGAE